MYKETLGLLIKYGEFFVSGKLTEANNNHPSQTFKSNFNELKLALAISPASEYKATDVYKEFVEIIGSFIPSKKRLHLINQLFIKLESEELDPFRGSGLTRYFLRYEIERNKKVKIENFDHIPAEVKQHFPSIIEILKKLNKSENHQLALKKSIQSVFTLIFDVHITDKDAEGLCISSLTTGISHANKFSIPEADSKNIEKAEHKFSFFIKILAILEGVSGQIQHALQNKEKNLGRLKLGFFEKFDANSLCAEMNSLNQVIQKIENRAYETMIKFNDGAMKLINMINEVDGYLDAIIEKIDSIIEEPIKDAAQASLAFLRMKRKEWFGENGVMLDPLLNPQAKQYQSSSQQPPKVSFSLETKNLDNKVEYYRNSLGKLLEELDNLADDIIIETANKSAETSKLSL